MAELSSSGRIRQGHVAFCIDVQVKQEKPNSVIQIRQPLQDMAKEIHSKEPGAIEVDKAGTTKSNYSECLKFEVY